MKNIKIFLLVLIAIPSLGLVLKANESEEYGIELRAQMLKHVYLKREPVWIKIILINTSFEIHTIGAPKFSILSLDLDLENSSGKKYGFCGICATFAQMPICTLEAHDTLVIYYNILESYGDGIEKPSGSFEHIVYRWTLLPDSYTLRVIYKDRLNKEKLVSEKLSFCVEKPQDEEREAYDLLCIGLKSNQRSDFQKLIDNYPHSVYAERAQYRIAGQTPSWDEIERINFAIDELKKLLENYPNSPYSKLPGTIYILAYCFVLADRREEGMEYIEAYIETHPDVPYPQLAKDYLTEEKFPQQ